MDERSWIHEPPANGDGAPTGSDAAPVNPAADPDSLPYPQEEGGQELTEVMPGDSVVSDQGMVVSEDNICSQTTTVAQTTYGPPSETVLDNSRLPASEAPDLSLDTREPFSEMTDVGDNMAAEICEPEPQDMIDDTTASQQQQQPEGMVTDMAALCYTGEPQLLTSITAPFSADNFTKGCKWSPDGTCLLVCSEDGRLRALNLPEPLYQSATTGTAPSAPLPEPQVALQSHEGELIYDYAWFPLMRSDDPATCCYASTSRAHPVHLFDAFDGGLRCSYRAYNSVDEVAAAYSVAFDPAGEQLLAGLDGAIAVFDVSRPGRQLETRKLKDKQSLTSQPGLVSCMGFCSAAPSVYAVGTYLRSVGVYSALDGAPLCLLQGQTGGVTHLHFSPDGRRLYSGGRKDPEILCWDLRQLGRILFTVQRNVTTNQRVYFDTDWSGRYLFSGDCDGHVQVWDTHDEQPSADVDEEALLLSSVRKFSAHNDCCNGLSAHPWLPVIATSSGQRHLAGLLDSSDDDEGDDSPPLHRRAESAVKLWWLGN